MKQFFLAVFTIITVSAFGQDTVRRSIGVRTEVRRQKLDTNQVVYDEQGRALHYYQYQRLINTGDYTIARKGADPNGIFRIKRLTDQEKNSQYNMIKKYMAIKSPVLQENSILNVTPLTRAMSPADLDGKVIVLIFWNANCSPCTETFASLNEFLKQIHNPEDLVLLAITPDSREVADAKLKEKPLFYTQLLSGAGSIMRDYQLAAYPSFVVTDKAHVIRYAISGSGPITIPSLKSVVKAVLFQ